MKLFSLSRPTQTILVVFFSVDTFISVVTGDLGEAVQTGLFAIACTLYLFTTRVVDMQREIMTRQSEAMKQQQELTQLLHESNTRLISSLQAELRGRTMEQLDRQRKSTWS